MINNQGQAVRTVTPSFCAEVYGWRELPQAGDEVIEVKSMVSLFLCHFLCTMKTHARKKSHAVLRVKQ